MNNPPKTQFKGVILLLLTALIWGTSFVSQSIGIESVGAFTFIAIRTLLGSIFLLPFIIVKAIKNKIQIKNIKYGIILGLVLCAASNFQQFAFYYSSAGKIAFITVMYMFFVPIFGLFFHKKVLFLTWICVIIAVAGMYFLCFPENKIDRINKGDIFAFICAFLFSFHILLIEKFSQKCNNIELSFIQFFTTGIIGLVLMFVFEQPVWKNIKKTSIPILYSGLFSCGIASTMQIVGQKYCEATIASLLMSMESAFAVIAAAIILHDRLSSHEKIGCIVMFSAILISQVSDIIKERRTQ